jgi:Dyp-type peroxidase family
MANSVARSDIQSLLVSAHGRLPDSVAVWLRVRDPTGAVNGLRSIVDDISFDTPKKSRTHAVHLLVSAAGLRALDVPDQQLNGLSRPFLQGITAPHRSRALGDLARNDPKDWVWNDASSHAILLIYGCGTDERDACCNRLLARLGQAWEVSARLETRQPADNCEHFGFRDGITDLEIDGWGRKTRESSTLVPAGELLLGYRNALGVLERVPAIGQNGSYVAVRQLAQDVRGFWEFWKGQGDSLTAVWQASKALGRWPNGMPVSGSKPCPQPVFDDKVVDSRLSFRDDLYGDSCPLGSHIRRANPRDGAGTDPRQSSAVSSTHHILRRGRMYGPSAPADWFPPTMEKKTAGRESGEGERGLLLIALCSDLSRQFEFIQQTWLNNPKQSGNFDEVDPIAGGDGIAGDGLHFCIPRDPVRLRLSNVRRWVTVRGGGYFLLPGRSALEKQILAHGSSHTG